MAITISYSWQIFWNVTYDTAIAGNLFALQGGGFAALGRSGSQTLGDLIGPDGSDVGGWDGPSTGDPFATSNYLAGAQLNNGSMASVLFLGSTLYVEVRNSTGAAILAPTSTGELYTQQADVAALQNGGFCVVSCDYLNAHKLGQIELRLYNAAGVEQRYVAVTDGGNWREDPQVAVLDNGRIAIAWTQQTTQPAAHVYYAVYEANGDVVVAAGPVPASGATMRNVSICATSNGGFALAYEDNGWAGGRIQTSLETFDNGGNHIGGYQISNNTTETDIYLDMNPQVERVSNEYLAVSYYLGSAQHTALVNQTTGAVVFESAPGIARSLIVGLGGDGRIGVLTDTNGGDTGGIWQAYRATLGDDNPNVLVGDSIMDDMAGGGGADTMSGAGGDDYVSGGDGNDVVSGGAGDDHVSGGAGDDTVSGDAGEDDVRGYEGADILRGGGGADGISGGDDIDTATYAGSSAGVTVNLVTGLGAGGDAAGDQLSLIENLIGSGFDDVLTGNGANNVLTGQSGDDTLSGAVGADTLDGGAGADVMSGGAGNDTYVVNSAGDIVNENANAGSDTIQSLLTRVLAANFENLTLLGANAIDGTGNGAANVITGNSAVNTLRGGASNDVLIGAAGADVLRGDGGSDTASYSTAAARVRVNLTTGLGLEADAQGDTYDSIERLTGTNFNDQLTGSSVGNVLMGGTGVDILDGRGGQDLLVGGGGKDVFVFSAGLGAADTIDDFAVGNDTIRLDNSIFTGLAAGALAAAAFHIGAAAADASDRIIYNSANGFLSFDRDGTGAQTAIHFATLDAGLAVTNMDFAVV